MAQRTPRDPGWYQLGSDHLYPWHDWFDGTTWELTPGDDFTEQVTNFRQRCYREAYSRQYRLRTRLLDGKLYLQALAWDGSLLGDLP